MRGPSAPIVLSWGKAEKGKGQHTSYLIWASYAPPLLHMQTPYAPTRALVPPSHLHMYIISRTLRGGR